MGCITCFYLYGSLCTVIANSYPPLCLDLRSNVPAFLQNVISWYQTTTQTASFCSRDSSFMAYHNLRVPHGYCKPSSVPHHCEYPILQEMHYLTAGVRELPSRSHVLRFPVRRARIPVSVEVCKTFNPRYNFPTRLFIRCDYLR